MPKQYTTIFYMKRKQQAQISAEIILALLFPKTEPNSVIDFGCATGTWLAVCKRLGATSILGLDGDWVDRELLDIETKEFSGHDFGLMKYAPEHKFDLALCIEVAEHLSQEMGKLLIESITEASDVILFSAAISYQGGTGHKNEQPQHYWAYEFRKHGYVCVDLIRPAIWENDSVNVIYKQNMFIYMKRKLCENLGFRKQVISEKYELDRIHPDLFLMRTKLRKNNDSKTIIRRLELFVKGLRGK